MADPMPTLDLSEPSAIAAKLAELIASGEPFQVVDAQHTLAVLTPSAPASAPRQVNGVAVPLSTKPRRRRKTGVITPDDPFWQIVGISEGTEGDPTDVSSNKKKYLADAYADLHE